MRPKSNTKQTNKEEKLPLRVVSGLSDFLSLKLKILMQKNLKGK